MSRTIPLSDGFQIPVIGLGTYKVPNPGEVEAAAKVAIDAGYRHLDCAWINGNEVEMGRAVRDKVRQKLIAREDVFVTTKLWNNFHKRKSVVPALQRSLKNLNMNYVDLYLMHWPIGFKETAGMLPLNEGPQAYSDVDYVETWKGMEDCLSCGYARSIGVANFNSQQIERLLRHAEYKPVVNQIEVHPAFSQKKLVQFCQDRGIVVSAYCPLGSNEHRGLPGFPERVLLDSGIREIGENHKKSAVQVALNYLVSRRLCVVPKSLSSLRIREFIDSFDFQLGPDEVRYLDSCNRNHRVCPLGAFKNHKYYPFRIEF